MSYTPAFLMYQQAHSRVNCADGDWGAFDRIPSICYPGSHQYNHATEGISLFQEEGATRGNTAYYSGAAISGNPPYYTGAATHVNKRYFTEGGSDVNPPYYTGSPTHSNTPYYTHAAWSVVPDLHIDYSSCTSFPELPPRRPRQKATGSHWCHSLSSSASQNHLSNRQHAVTAPPLPIVDLSAGVSQDIAVACATSGALTPEVAFSSATVEKENRFPSRLMMSRRARSGKYTSSFDKVASRILNTWFIRNQSCPYPTPETLKCLAESCNLEMEQVRKWFQNKRSRTGTSRKTSKKPTDSGDYANIRL